jgi:hypothetical protein
MPGWPLHLLQCLLVAVVIVAPLPLALALVRRYGSADHERLENLLATTVFSITVQLVLGLTLGLLGFLNPGAVIVTSALVLGVGIGLARAWGVAEVLPATRLDPVEGGALTVVLIAGGLGLADLVVHPTRNFDSLAYHLPVMARWVSSGNLEVFAALGQVALYPSHFELLSTLLHLPLQHDLLISAPNLLTWAQLGLAILLVARRLGANRQASIVAAALVMLMPSILSRLDAIQPDIALAATFLTAIGFALRSREHGSPLDTAVLLLCVGILAGWKLSGPVFVLLLVPVLLAGDGGPRGALRGLIPERARGFVVGVAAVAVAIGLAWYVRNWVTLGNPFGDLQIELFGASIFEGSISRAELQRGALSNVFRVGSAEDWGVLGEVLWQGLGAGAGFLLVAAILAFKGAAGLRRSRFVVAALMLLCLVLYWRTPYSGDNGTHDWRVTPWIEVGLRYGFPVVSLLGVFGAVGASRNRWWSWVGLGILVVTAVLTVLEELVPHIVVLAFVVVAAWGGALLAMGRRVAPMFVRATAVLALALVVVGLGLAREQREARRARNFGTIMEVLASELAADDVVGVVNSQKLHLAAGRDWRRRVELPSLPKAGEEQQWVTRMRREGITALLVGHQKPPPEQAADVERVQHFVRGSGRFELVLDYESLAKDLALFRIVR